ncbi:MAG: hypothetical protein P8X57_04930 [Cyclobacteriaceae bacterium]
MRKGIRFIIVTLVIFLVIHAILGFWIQNRFQSLINSRPDRKYNISYSNPSGSGITGSVKSITIDGLDWIKLLLHSELELEVLSFEQPEFELEISADTEEKPKTGRSFQDMFADILSRVHRVDFQRLNGRINVTKTDSTGKSDIFRLNDLDINAYGVRTDSIQMKNFIPFHLERLKAVATGMEYQLDEYSVLGIGKIVYQTDSSLLDISDIEISLTKDRLEVSQLAGFQKDIIELTIARIGLHDLKKNSSGPIRVNENAINCGTLRTRHTLL